MLDNPVIVSDEEIKEGDSFLCSNEVHKCTGSYSLKVTSYVKCEKGDCSKEICQKIIAQSHQIDWNNLEHKFGYVDVEKLAKEEYIKQSVKDDRLSLDEQIQRSGGFHVGFIEGFKKAQELNDKKFSLEDMESFASFTSKNLMRHSDGFGMYLGFDKVFELWKSKSQPKSFSIEVEMEGCSECHLNEGYMNSPNCCRNIKTKITYGKIKITKKI